MDQNIKNFDRAVEQRMNEQQVPPPFGAWNRIAAELDAMPVAEAAPVNNLIPKRAIASFIAGVIIMGSAVATGFWVGSMHQDKHIASANNAAITIKAASFTSASTNGINDVSRIGVINAVSPISRLPKYTAFADRPAKAKVTSKAFEAMPTAANTNAEVSAPIPVVSLPANDLKATAFYLSPIDVVTLEKCKTEVEEPRMAKVDDGKISNDDDRPKTETRKFKPRRRKGGWGYGSVNRM